MIIGIGTDIVSVDRIAAALERFGERFRNRVYTEHELALADRLPDRAGVLAKRWAAKEACSKALGTGLRRGVALRDIMVETTPGGMPEIRLAGKSRERLAAISPRGHDALIHVSMTDDRPWAAAIVVIEARPAGDLQA